MKIFLYYLAWFINCKILKKEIPLNGSIVITDKCNLNCKHCTVANLGYEKSSFKNITDSIKKLYHMGIRALVITGGEPFLWKDNSYSLEDIIDYAKGLGFFWTVVCTNGTFRLESSANFLWVSLDGEFFSHNRIRGKVYFQVIKNIFESSHKNIFINFTVSKLNIDNLESSTRTILNNPRIKGILFHLFTPYIGAEKIELNNAEKLNVLKKIYSIKRKYPLRIINSFDGIKAMIGNNWVRPVSASKLINQGKINDCCCREGIYSDYTCQHCGCSPAVETWVLYKMKPLAIIENLRYLFW